MQVDLFRRVIAGAFVMTMGVVAALPYHRTPPPLAQLPDQAMQPFATGTVDAASTNVAEASFGTEGSAPPVESDKAAAAVPKPLQPQPPQPQPPQATTRGGQPAQVSPLLTQRHRPTRTPTNPVPAARTNPAAPTLTSEVARGQASPTLRVAAAPAANTTLLDPLHAANPIVESSFSPGPTAPIARTAPRPAGPKPSEIATPPAPPMASQFPSTLTPDAARPMTPVHLDATSRFAGSSPGRAVGHAPATPPPGRATGGVNKRGVNEPRKYVIRDGDTLSNIAARLLGTPERAGEIYQINRGRLPSPQILPLGVEILVPPAQPGPDGMVPVYIDIGT